MTKIIQGLEGVLMIALEILNGGGLGGGESLRRSQVGGRGVIFFLKWRGNVGYKRLKPIKQEVYQTVWAMLYSGPD